ncbi:MAG: hypothetical protein H6557_24935 [Lewinellaceae bacterium]|nr:hypothetical protein [Lewinellaceae bacterium]
MQGFFHAMDVERSDIPANVGAVDAMDAMDAMDAVDAMDVERSDIPANVGAVDAMDAMDAVDAMDVERSDIPAHAGAVDAIASTAVGPASVCPREWGKRSINSILSSTINFLYILLFYLSKSIFNTAIAA